MRTSIAVATFFCVWFITLFAVLPFYAKPQDEAGDVVPGTPGSAPTEVRVWRVVLVNTIVASVTFAIIYLLISNISMD